MAAEAALDKRNNQFLTDPPPSFFSLSNLPALTTTKMHFQLKKTPKKPPPPLPKKKTKQNARMINKKFPMNNRVGREHTSSLPPHSRPTAVLVSTNLRATATAIIAAAAAKMKTTATRTRTTIVRPRGACRRLARPETYIVAPPQPPRVTP